MSENGSGETLNVALVIPNLSGGGAEYVARKWAESLSANYEVTIWLTDGSDGDAADSTVKSVAGGGGFLGAILRMRTELLLSRYQVVIALMPYSNLVVLLATLLMPRTRTPAVVISEHNLHEGLSTQLGYAFRIQLFLARRFYRRANAVIAVSHAVGAEVMATCSIRGDRLWVVPNPAAELSDLEFKPRPSPSTHASLSLVVPARLVSQKRPWLVISIAEQLRDAHEQPATVHFFGEGPLASSLADQAREAGVERVFHGWVDRWFEHIPNGGIVVLPSMVEGFGNVLVEAAAASVPVVVSSRALGAADALLPNVTGVLVAGDSPMEYSAGVLRAQSMEIPDVSAWLARFTLAECGPILSTCLSAAVRDRSERLMLNEQADAHNLSHFGNLE